jgi:hypothetical protein
VGVERIECDDRLTKHRGREVESGEPRCVVIALQGLSKHIRWVVALVTPRVHIDGRIERAESRAQDNAETVNLLRKA